MLEGRCELGIAATLQTALRKDDFAVGMDVGRLKAPFALGCRLHRMTLYGQSGISQDECQDAGNPKRERCRRKDSQSKPWCNFIG